MKKILISMSAIALGALALTSCGGTTTTSKLTGADGEEITLKETSDSTEVSKALYAVGTKVTNTEKNVYAFQAKVTADANLNVEFGGYNIGAKLTADATVKASLGKGVTYAKYEFDDEPTEEQVAAANEVINKNVKLEATATASLTTTAKKVEEELNAAETSEVDPVVAALNNQTVSATAKAAKDDDTLYASANVKASEGLMNTLTMFGVQLGEGETTTSLDKDFGVKAKLNLGNVAVSISNAVNSLREFDLNTIFPAETATTSTTNASFYDSESFKMIVSYVEKLGVTISSVKNGVVKFELDLNGKKLNDLTKVNADTAVSINAITTTNESLFDDETSYVSAYVTVDVNKSSINAMGVNLKDISVFTSALSAFAKYSSNTALKMLSMAEIGGSIKLDAEYSFDDDVKFELSKDSFDTKDYLTTTLAF